MEVENTRQATRVVTPEGHPLLQARIQQGRVELQDPIPKDWDGQLVKILPLTPDDPLPDLEARLAALHAFGPGNLTVESFWGAAA